MGEPHAESYDETEVSYNNGDILGQHKIPTTTCLKSRALNTRAISYNKKGIL